jgi:RNA polymerase sigma-70 factor, ECF subfamily
VAELLSDETELIARAQAGDRAAFCALASRYERRIYALARHYCRNAHDAEDLSQEVWLRAFRALADFRGAASFYTWLRRITVHTFLNYRRARAHSSRDESLRLDQLECAAGVEADAPRVHDAERALHNRMLVAQVLDALAELPAQQRLVFLLKHEEGMTYEEIAAALGCAPGTVKKALHRAVLKLRTRLCAQTELPPDAVDLTPCAAPARALLTRDCLE